jgi:SAM-dependent methyltransferase
MAEEYYREVVQVSKQTFDRIWGENKETWGDAHALTPRTADFIRGILAQSERPLIHDIGGGDANKAIRMYMIARYLGGDLDINVFDSSGNAIRKGKQRIERVGLNNRIKFIETDILDIDPSHYPKAEGLFDYQALTHLPTIYRSRFARIVAELTRPRGLALTNKFDRNTHTFYGLDISQLDSGEVIGWDSIDGMYCYFYTPHEIEETYDPYFEDIQIVEVPHSDPEKIGRYHLEALMTRRES